MHSHRLWVIALAPGIVLAGLIAGTGRPAFGLGVLLGVLLAVASQALLVVFVRGITTPSNWKRTVAVVSAQVLKYLVIGLAIYVAVHHPQVDSIGMFVGITAAVAGFVAGQVVTNPAPGSSDRRGD